MDLVNLATMYTIKWIQTVGKYHFSSAKTVEELKQIVKQRLFPTKPVDSLFIKGAKLVNWEAVLKAIQVMTMFFIVSTVSASEYKVVYTFSSKSAGKSLVISTPKTKQGDSLAGGYPKQKTAETKIARINPPKKGIVESDIEPYKKYLTEQGAKTRQTVLKIAEQVYSGQDLVAFDNLIKAESGYRYDALNEIQAGGLGQALPYTKMGCELTEEDIPCQVNWMMGYIDRRYHGSPTEAWLFWLSEVPINGKQVGHWY